MRPWICLALSAIALSAFTAASAAAPEPAAAQKPLDAQQLDAISAGQAGTVALTNQALTAVNSGNSITAASVRSGDISFNAQALSNFTGIGNFVVNTGANNNLQGSLSVTVVAAPALGR
jgi:hypothetical protein